MFPFKKKALANGKSTAIPDDVFEKRIGSVFVSVPDSFLLPFCKPFEFFFAASVCKTCLRISMSSVKDPVISKAGKCYLSS